jgi:hypothetical protein
LFGQDDYREHLIWLMNGDQKEAEQDIISHLATPARQIYLGIEIKHDGGTVVAPGPYAIIEHGKRRIYFSPAFYNLLQGSVDAVLLGPVLHRENFVAEYFAYFRAHLSGADNPFQFAGMSNAQIDAYYKRPDVRGVRGILIYSAFVFVFMHEIGHHVLGHCETPYSTLAEARNRERAADQFACVSLMENGVIPIGGLFALALLDDLNLEDVKYEGQQTHPASVKRLTAVGNYILENIDSYEDRFKDRGADLNLTKQNLRNVLDILNSR